MAYGFLLQMEWMTTFTSTIATDYLQRFINKAYIEEMNMVITKFQLHSRVSASNNSYQLRAL